MNNLKREKKWERKLLVFELQINIYSYFHSFPCIYTYMHEYIYTQYTSTHTLTLFNESSKPENIFIAQHPNIRHTHTHTTYTTHSFALFLSFSLWVLGEKYLARQSQAIIIFYFKHHRCRLGCCWCCCRYRHYHHRSFTVPHSYHALTERERASKRENKGVYLNILNFCITKRGCEFV